MNINNQQSGFTLIVIMVAVVIVAAIFFGSSFFSNKEEKEHISTLQRQIQALEKAKTDISEINTQVIENSKQTTKN